MTCFSLSKTDMEVSNSSLLIQRNVNIKAVVTDLWKEEAQQTLQSQLNQIDGELQNLDLRLQQIITEIQRQTIQSSGTDPGQQIEALRTECNQRKSELLDQKNQVLQNLQNVQTLNPDQEVVQGQIPSVFAIQKGDNLYAKLQVEILVRDGIVVEIRGDI